MKHLAGIGLWIIFAGGPAWAQGASWEDQTQAGLQASQRAQYAQAESNFRAALEQASAFEEPDLRLPVSLFNLAETLATEGKDSAAQPLYEKALAAHEEISDQSPALSLRILTGLGVLYEDVSRYSEAESFYKQALGLSQSLSGADYSAVLKCIYNLSMLLAKEGRYSESRDSLQGALAFSDRINGATSPEDAFDENILALARASTGDYKDAWKLYKQSLSQLERFVGPIHPLVATVLTNLSSLQTQRHQYADADRTLQRAISIRQEVFGPNHKSVATDTSELAALRYLQHRYSEAEQLYVHAIEVWDRAGIQSLNVARSLENLGVVYVDDHKYLPAVGVFERAVKMKEMILGPEYPDVARGLTKLAIAETAAGRASEAEPAFQRSLSILEGASPRDYGSLIELLDSYAKMLITTGRRAQAELLQTRAMVYTAELKEIEGKNQNKSRLQRSLLP